MKQLFFKYMRLHNPLPHEKMVLVVRRHTVIFLLQIIWNLIMLAVPMPVIWFGQQYFSGLFFGELSWPIIIVFLSIYYLIVWLFFFINFIDLYLDVWIITNKRIINIEQRGLFSRTEAEHQLYVIQDISTEVRGIGATILNYGDLLIQTAGESQRVTFKQVPQPYYLKKIISDLVENNKQTARDDFSQKQK